MEDEHIKNFLFSKNKKFFIQLQNFEIIKKTLKDYTPFLDTENISIQGTVLTIKLPTTKKQELFLKKDKIINKINSLAGKTIITDIK